MRPLLHSNQTLSPFQMDLRNPVTPRPVSIPKGRQPACREAISPLTRVKQEQDPDILAMGRGLILIIIVSCHFDM